jgi:hypothetical protein
MGKSKPPDLPGRSFGYMWHLLGLNFQVLGPTPVSTELMLAIFWEESFFNNVFQAGAGTAVGFGQTEPYEFYRFDANGLTSPNPGIAAAAKYAKAKGYLVYGLPPVIHLGKKRARLSAPVDDYTSVRIACAMVRDLYERGQRSKQAIAKGYGSVGYAGSDQPAHLAEPGGREKVVGGWFACEDALKREHARSSGAMDPDKVMAALKLAKDFNRDEEFRAILFAEG